jgi:hypothetical protein
MPPDRASFRLIDERSSPLEARSIESTQQLDTTAAALDPGPPWLPPDSYPIEWEAFARFPNYLAAQIVSGLFENEGLPAIVTAWSAFPGVASAIVWVPRYLVHRARWIAALAPPSDAELLFMATGELSSEEERSK